MVLLISLMPQTNAQKVIHLDINQIPKERPIVYMVDHMRLDSAMFFSIGLQSSDVKNGRARECAGIVTLNTNFLVVLDGELITTESDKRAKLSGIFSEDIESITRIDKKEAIEKYGKKGRNGSLEIMLNPIRFMPNLHAQSEIRLRPTLIPEKLRVYVIDYIKMDSAMFFSVGLQPSDIRYSHKCEGILTKFLVVLNGELLSTKRDKRSKLSSIKLDDIESIKKIDKEESIERYGRKGRKGALEIKLKSVSTENTN